jgi:hypothetical protein
MTRKKANQQMIMVSKPDLEQIIENVHEAVLGTELRRRCST